MFLRLKGTSLFHIDIDWRRTLKANFFVDLSGNKDMNIYGFLNFTSFFLLSENHI